MTARFIVLEAIDLAGKTTQINALADVLRSRGLSVATVAYPDRRAKLTGDLIERFLIGTLPLVADPEGDPIGQMLAGQVIFSLNRREVAARLTALLDRHDVVLSSRYQLAGRVYAEAGGVQPAAITRIHAELEGDLTRPDLTLVMDLDPASVVDRPRDGGLDMFERDRTLQARVRAAYRRIAVYDPSVRIIDGSGTPDVVTTRFLAVIDGVFPSLAKRALQTQKASTASEKR